MTRGVFLDRDGTLIEEVGYLDRLEQIAFFPYSIDAVRLLNRAGFVVVVATNQSGVARGLFPESFVGEAHTVVADTIASGGGRIDAFYYCPHHPEAVADVYRRSCDCRKPGPGMLRRAADEHGIDLTRSFVVGDRVNDLAAGGSVGAAGVLVRTGYGPRNEEAARAAGAPIADNLMSAVSWILQQP